MKIITRAKYVHIVQFINRYYNMYSY